MKATTLRQVRQVHNYLAVFFAPAILFFAFTGGLQTTELFEARGNAAPPPRWISAIISLHKHQVVTGSRRRPPASAGTPGKTAPSASGSGARAGSDHDDHDRGFNPLKPFVVLLSIALFVTTALGLVIALTNSASRRLSLVLTIAGLIVPVAMILA